MTWLWIIVIGFIVGLVARALKPGDDSMGIIMTSVLGIAGSLASGLIGNTLGWYKEGDAVGFLAAVVGALLLLFIYGLLKTK
jgi:uncharacterized membrane protein YeaQ/YmgE (transglycosylase-associated protein family)